MPFNVNKIRVFNEQTVGLYTNSIALVLDLEHLGDNYYRVKISNSLFPDVLINLTIEDDALYIISGNQMMKFLPQEDTIVSPKEMIKQAEKQLQQPVNVRSDLRMLATAVEVYYLDNNAYPTWTTDKEFSLNYSLMEQTTNADW